MTTPHRHSTSEHGYTMVELIVAMVIIGILISIGTIEAGASRKAGLRAQIKAAARTYGDAIEQYQLEHSGMTPALDSTDWPVGKRPEGPMRSHTGKSYIGINVPEIMRGDWTSPTRGAGLQPFGSTAPAYGGTLVYERVGTPAVGYRLHVWVNGKEVCEVTDQLVKKADPCQ